MVTYPTLPNPTRLGYDMATIVSAIQITGVTLAILAGVHAVASVAYRYRLGDDMRRAQLRWILLAVIVASIGWWAFTLPSPRRVIVIATGQPSGQYHQFGLAFREALLHQAGRTVEVRETAGSVENRELLLSGAADIALLQAGAVSLNEIAVVAPLHRDVVFVIARSDRGIETIRDLEGREQGK